MLFGASVTSTGTDVAVFTNTDKMSMKLEKIIIYNEASSNAKITMKIGNRLIIPKIGVAANSVIQIDISNAPEIIPPSGVVYVNTDQQPVHITLVVAPTSEESG